MLGSLAIGVLLPAVLVYYHCCMCRLSQEGSRSRRAAAAAVNYKEPALGRQVLFNLCECSRITILLLCECCGMIIIIIIITNECHYSAVSYEKNKKLGYCRYSAGWRSLLSLTIFSSKKCIFLRLAFAFSIAFHSTTKI